MQNKRKEQGSGPSTYVRGIFWGCLWTLLCSLIFLLIFAFGISHNLFSEKIMQGSVVMICVIGSFIGALVGISKCRKRIMPLSLLIGATTFIVQLITGFAFFKETYLLNCWELVLGANLVGAIVAGLVYRKKNNGNRRKSIKH